MHVEEINVAAYLQWLNCASSIDTIAIGWDILAFPIIHLQSGGDVSLNLMFSWRKESFKASVQPETKSKLMMTYVGQC